MNITFYKYQGLGNDFVVIDERISEGIHEFLERNTLAIRNICNRNFGVGADGIVILVNPSYEGDVRMVIYNADGSEPEMCGNGIRCLIKYMFDLKILEFNSIINVETKSGLIKCEIDDNLDINVDMGIPILEPEFIPTNLQKSSLGIVQSRVKLDNYEFNCSAIGMGNPHLIVFVQDLKDLPIDSWGPKLERHESFPAYTNVHFVQVIHSGLIKVLVWERGCGTTLACGTGACACIAATSILKYTNSEANVELPGGTLFISWPNKNQSIYMKGPANIVYKGSLELNRDNE